MRTRNSIMNAMVAVLSNIIALLLGFIAQRYFISILGIEYTGLNGVLNNLISMLSIVELGLGTSIIYHLYKPIYENDIDSIKSLLKFYKKSYMLIAGIITLIGLLIIPFLKIIIDTKAIKESIYIIYILFLSDTVFSYFIAYKRSIIYANQKNRIVDFVHLLYTLFLNIFQIVLLIRTQNYILYLVIKIIFRLLENYIISIIADRMYPYIKEKNVKPVSKSITDEIKKMVYGQLYHQVGGNIVMGTDNIILSTFLGLSMSGIYANYTLLSNAANTILSQLFNALTGSIGNLLVEDNKNKTYSVYSKINFVNFVLFSFAATGLFFCVNPFIKLWLGNSNLVFHESWVLIFSINFFLQGMRRTLQVFASAGGICYENRFVPIMEATVNLIASLILVKLCGIYGIILGTILSKSVLYFYGFPKYIYQPLLGKKYKEYIIEIFKEFMIVFIMFILNFFVIKLINKFLIINLLSSLLINGFIVIIVNTIVLLVVYHNDENWLYFKNMLLSKLKL